VATIFTFVQSADPFGVALVHAGLQRRERRPALLVERDDLAVEHAVVAAGRPRERVELGVGDGDVVAVAGDQAEGAVLHVGEGADAVPLHLEGVGR
jgi:hypothetical protein